MRRYTILSDKNEDIQIVSKESDWTKVIHNNKTGYVYSKYISEKSSTTSNIDYKNYECNCNCICR